MLFYWFIIHNLVFFVFLYSEKVIGNRIIKKKLYFCREI